MFLKISQNSRENTCVGIFFRPETLLKADSGIAFFQHTAAYVTLTDTVQYQKLSSPYTDFYNPSIYATC